MNEFLMTVLIFSACSLINVMFNTAKTIIMYKKNIWSSATINALTYGFYTVVVVLMAGEMPLLWKIMLTAVTNFIGVCLSMLILKKFDKDKLWKVEATISAREFEENKEILKNIKVPHNYIDIGKYYIVNFYCATCKQSEIVKSLLSEMNAKYFVVENRASL